LSRLNPQYKQLRLHTFENSIIPRTWTGSPHNFFRTAAASASASASANSSWAPVIMRRSTSRRAGIMTVALPHIAKLLLLPRGQLAFVCYIISIIAQHSRTFTCKGAIDTCTIQVEIMGNRHESSRLTKGETAKFPHISVRAFETMRDFAEISRFCLTESIRLLAMRSRSAIAAPQFCFLYCVRRPALLQSVFVNHLLSMPFASSENQRSICLVCMSACRSFSENGIVQERAPGNGKSRNGVHTSTGTK